MTVKDKIKRNLRWEGGKTYIGKREGWPEMDDSHVAVPETMPQERLEVSDIGTVGASTGENDGKDAYIETPEGFNPFETLMDRFTDEEPENVDMEAEEESRRLAREVREEMIKSMGAGEAERAGIDKWAEIPEPEPVLFGSAKEEAQQAKLAEAAAEREAAQAEKKPEPEPAPAEEPASDSGRTLSPEEIATMFAESAGEAVREVEAELNGKPSPTEKPAEDDPMAAFMAEPIKSAPSDDKFELPDIDLDNVVIEGAVTKKAEQTIEIDNPLTDDVNFTEQEMETIAAELQAEQDAEAAALANAEAAAAGAKGKKKSKKDRNGKKKTKGFKDKLLRRKNRKEEPAAEEEEAQEVATVSEINLSTKKQHQEQAGTASAAETEAVAQEEEKTKDSSKSKRRSRNSVKEKQAAAASETAPADDEKTVATVEEIKPPEPEPDYLQDVTEFVMADDKGDMAVSLEEAEDMARQQLKAQHDAEAAATTKTIKETEPDPIDPSKIKVPFYLKKNPKKREAYIKKQIKKLRAKLRKKAEAEKKKAQKAELAVKKKEEKAQKKAEWKAGKPERKKAKKAAKKEKKATKKEKKAEKKLKKKEKKAERKAKRRAWWKAQPALDRTIYKQLIIILALAALISGWMFLPGIINKTTNSITSIPDNIKADMAEKKLEKEMAKINPEDEELLANVESTVAMQPMEHNVLRAFGIEENLSKVNVRYVSTNGDDKAVGSEEAPLRTIQAGIDQLQAGGVLYVMPGTYNEQLHISKVGDSKDYITITTYNTTTTEKAIIDGKGIANGKPLVTIENSKYLTFCNMELINAGTGIEVTNSKAIILSALDIHDLRAVGYDQVVEEKDEEGNVIGEYVVPGPKAYGISVKGSTSTVTRSVLIYYNNIYGINRGSGVYVEGNTEYVNLLGNHIYSIGGNGVEYVGGTGLCRDAVYDAPRKATIENNSIRMCNNAEGTGYGFMLDTTRNMTLKGNVIYRSGIGFCVTSKLGPEDTYGSGDIVIENNLITCNTNGGAFIGTDPLAIGFIDNVNLSNNSFINTYNEDEGFDIMTRNVGKITIMKNILFNDKASGTLICAEENILGTPQYVVEGNLYATTAKMGSAKFKLNGKDYKGYTAFKKGVREETGLYYSGDLTSLLIAPDKCDYSYKNHGSRIGCVIVEGVE